ncbi:MAG: hypothetical protein JNK87_00395 [Bryobacterales bacterium]|nr:hypothetical protein [Bryobacterales bacterium]
MTDLISIYVVAWMFYLIDGIRGTGLQAWVFRPRWRGNGYRASKPLIYPSNGDWGWVILNVIRPGRPVLIVDPPEIRLAASGLVLGRPDDARKLQVVQWDAFASTAVDDGEVAVNGSRVRCTDPQLWRACIDKLRHQHDDEDVIGSLAASFQQATLKTRLAAFRKASGRLPLLVSTELLTIVVLLPLLGVLLGPGPGILATAMLLFGQSSAIAVLFARAHTELYGRKARGVAWKMGLYPIAAVRAMDELARPLLAPYHPVAIASVLADKEDRAVIGRQALRDALFPLLAAGDVQQISDALRWHASTMERLLRQAGVTADLMPVPQQSGDAKGYCPRCLAQYREAAGDCGDCPGVALRAFAERRSGKG